MPVIEAFFYFTLKTTLDGTIVAGPRHPVWKAVLARKSVGGIVVVPPGSVDVETVADDGSESADVVASPIPDPPTAGPQPSASPINTTAADAARWVCPQKGHFTSPV